MMKEIIIKRNAIIIGTNIWWLIFIVLALTNFNSWQIQNIVGFAFLIIMPGLLTVLIFNLKELPFWGYAGLAVGFSILELMMVGLIGNTILPHFGIAFPLQKTALLIELFIPEIPQERQF